MVTLVQYDHHLTPSRPQSSLPLPPSNSSLSSSHYYYYYYYHYYYYCYYYYYYYYQVAPLIVWVK